MIVYLVRHAEAEPKGARGDAGRALTPEGRRRFAELARASVAPGRIVRVLASPARRALETAEILAGAAGAEVEAEPALAAGRSTAGDLLALARTRGEGTALVGHNPEMAEAVALAAGREERVAPGTIAAVELTDGGWRLVWLRSPPK